MKEIRILFTGVGRRVELLQSFRQAALTLDVKLTIFGADVAGKAPALSYCDFKREVCKMKDKEYIPILLRLCKSDNIDLVIPTIDTDLLVLSKHKNEFAQMGVRVLISEPKMVGICRDKNRTIDFFKLCGLKAPQAYTDYSEYPGPYPCFIKPKDGSGSVNAFQVNAQDELAMYVNKIEDYIIQPFIEGCEYTVDIFCDFEGKPIYITPRERVAVRAGEVLKTKIVSNDVIIQECKRLIKEFKPCGPMTVQLIRDKYTGDNYYIEINPRYGGGAPLSMKSGARSAEALLRLLLGDVLGYQEKCISIGAIYSRFDQSVCIFEGRHAQPIKGVIFDLDDTLYSEKEYVRSGCEKIANFLGKDDDEEKLWNYFLEGKPVIDSYLEEIFYNEKRIECVNVYRNQIPKIQLYDGVKKLIQDLKKTGIKVGIITDGRVEGQKKKLIALELPQLVDDIIITDELGGIQFRKPNDISFRIMQCRWKIPFEQMIYVGDNLSKDFQAPMQLGMNSLYFRNSDGLHCSNESSNLKEVKNINSMRYILMSML